MKESPRPPTSPSSGSPAPKDGADKDAPRKQAQSEPAVAKDTVRKIDRPGFDLDGSSGETHAGTGLGLGDDASDTSGDRRLPGRRPDDKLTIPRWAGPDQQDAAAPVEASGSPATPSQSAPKKSSD